MKEIVTNMVNISEISLIPIRAQKGLAFFASFVIENKFFVGNIALYSRLNRPGEFRTVYPTKILQNGNQIPVFYPINKQVGGEIENVLSEEANRLLNSPEDRLVGRYIFGRGRRD